MSDFLFYLNEKELPEAHKTKTADIKNQKARAGEFAEGAEAILCSLNMETVNMNTSIEKIRYAIAQSVLGYFLVATSEKGVCAIFMADETESLLSELKQTFPRAQLTEENHALSSLSQDVAAYISHPDSSRRFKLDVRGTPFQQRVWKALRAVPAGETRTYQQIAGELGDKGAVRAVAGACAANVIAVAIPCHRVIRKDGSLSGYRWGIGRKRQLLSSEIVL
ncbi:methylated-DNA--[protein]-cysteine S-methyltransferase [Pantoea sp. EABMAA-21]|uniref:methylated-DNA--[protein]-cysteine S-methyltransferase n=1 Tax=Enterobacterales TaxID=91347 RepID=UPI0024AFE440|nr:MULTISPECIES: methylated-DNA--[protein]-cysteine S-methyltransferase [Enterobacterales]MDI6934684.1 methylated-DNA--[protein]-cysteine S-methyltransferase [Serratia sp. Se-PFBMAAmG]MDI9225791.1 methylated-DNA--[protein]-cysteine S-methyltransferase [Serratia bockelmannii]MDI9223639.1 methylated-DNA--[protein]-cysteine S-methyltransferase [Pantoea sp. EA-12]MDI9265889.1 methylated-DNA--[protein]-cysteine S-methyltransferase [Serratia sp. PF2-63]MDI9267143.1 methylated-DNA--[protein]-cysteine